MEMDRVKIKLDEYGKGSIVINGHELKSTSGVTVKAVGGVLTQVTIYIVAEDVEIEAPAEITKEVGPLSIDSIESVRTP